MTTTQLFFRAVVDMQDSFVLSSSEARGLSDDSREQAPFTTGTVASPVDLHVSAQMVARPPPSCKVCSSVCVLLVLLSFICLALLLLQGKN